MQFSFYNKNLLLLLEIFILLFLKTIYSTVVFILTAVLCLLLFKVLLVKLFV